MADQIVQRDADVSQDVTLPLAEADHLFDSLAVDEQAISSGLTLNASQIQVKASESDQFASSLLQGGHVIVNAQRATSAPIESGDLSSTSLAQGSLVASNVDTAITSTGNVLISSPLSNNISQSGSVSGSASNAGSLTLGGAVTPSATIIPAATSSTSPVFPTGSITLASNLTQPGVNLGSGVKLQMNVQEGMIHRQGFVNGAPGLLAFGAKLADLNIEQMTFVMQGSWINWNKAQAGQAILVNRGTAGQVTLWAATLDANLTKAVQLRLFDTAQGVMVETLQAKYTAGNMLNDSFNFNVAGIPAPLATASGASGYGVAAVSTPALATAFEAFDNVTNVHIDVNEGNLVINAIPKSPSSNTPLVPQTVHPNFPSGNELGNGDVVIVAPGAEDDPKNVSSSHDVKLSITRTFSGQAQGVRVNLQTGVQEDLVQRQGFVNGTPSLLAQGVKLADLDIEGMSFVMQGSWINWNKPQAGQAILVNRNAPGQATFWAATVDGTLTKAVQLRLEDTEQGVTVQTLQAKYTSGNVLNGSFNFNTSGIAAPVATASGAGGYGVAAMSGRALGDTLTGIENVVGTKYNDHLVGDAGSNVLTGGAGYDTLAGGLGADTYVFGRGTGQDLVVESDTTPNTVDVAMWDSAVKSDQLWFTRAGNDLRINVIGGEDQVTVQNWYFGSQHQIERFVAGDGKALLNSQVDALVSAMAQFAPPAAGQTVLSSAYQSSLSTTLAANWK